ncbi:checkpoint protein HUS1 isoform 2-T2 [Anableps anableps]
MKFRGKITDIACLNHFTRVVTTISKLTKTCVLRLTPDHLFFILSGKVTNGGVGMWCQLLQANFFQEYQMEGVSSEVQEICLEVSPEPWSRALKTVQSAKSVKLKLTRKHCACLTVAAELPTLSSLGRVVTHDVPVDVIPRRLWQEFQEPSVPDFDVSVYLPPLKTMKSVVDRMKNLSNFLVIEANLNGEMNLKIQTHLVSVTTHFKDLGSPPWGRNICKHLQLFVPHFIPDQLSVHASLQAMSPPRTEVRLRAETQRSWPGSRWTSGSCSSSSWDSRSTPARPCAVSPAAVLMKTGEEDFISASRTGWLVPGTAAQQEVMRRRPVGSGGNVQKT